MSQRPGRRVFPRASTISAPFGISTVPSAPTAAMRLPETTTVVFGREVAVAASKRVAPVKTSGAAGTRLSAFVVSAVRAVSARRSASSRAGIAASHPSRTTLVHGESLAK